jgi:hypothetical protein
MKNQSKILNALLAAAITGSLALSALPALADDLILSGSVDPVTTITPSAAAALGSTLRTAGLSAFTVSTIVEKNNVAAGYTVSLSSANSAEASGAPTFLKSPAGTTPITYTMTYGGTEVTLTASGEAVDVTDATAPTTNMTDGDSKILAITIDAVPNAVSGTYSDTITLTVAPK